MKKLITLLVLPIIAPIFMISNRAQAVPTAARAAASAPSASAVYLKTAREIRLIHARLHIGDFVTGVQSRLTEVDQEVRTQSGGSSWGSDSRASAGASLEDDFRGRWASAQATAYSHSQGFSSWDMTDIIVANPEQVAGFEAEVSANDSAVRSQLLAYMNRNEASLIRMKELGVLNLAAAHQMIVQGHDVSGIEETVRLLGDLNFYGANQITSCVSLRTIDRTWTSGSSFEAGARASVASEDYWTSMRAGSEAYTSLNGSSYWHQFGVNEKKCSSSLNTITVAGDESVFSVNLSELDSLILRWVQSIDVARMAHTKLPLYPTFNSPYDSPTNK